MLCCTLISPGSWNGRNYESGLFWRRNRRSDPLVRSIRLTPHGGMRHKGFPSSIECPPAPIAGIIGPSLAAIAIPVIKRNSS